MVQGGLGGRVGVGGEVGDADAVDGADVDYSAGVRAGGGGFEERGEGLGEGEDALEVEG